MHVLLRLLEISIFIYQLGLLLFLVMESVTDTVDALLCFKSSQGIQTYIYTVLFLSLIFCSFFLILRCFLYIYFYFSCFTDVGKA